MRTLIPLSCLIASTALAEPEARALTSFHAIQVGGGIDLAVSPGDATSVTVTADNPQRIVTLVKDDTLLVYVQGGDGAGKAQVTVTSPQLDAVTAGGASQVNVSGFSNKVMSIHANGKTNVTASGTADLFSLLVSGEATIKARELHAQKTTLQVSGGGSLEVCAEKQLAVIINGAAQVGYDCHPGQVRQNIHGAGTVKQL
jgi:hypothetical protein